MGLVLQLAVPARGGWNELPGFEGRAMALGWTQELMYHSHSRPVVMAEPCNLGPRRPVPGPADLRPAPVPQVPKPGLLTHVSPHDICDILQVPQPSCLGPSFQKAQTHQLWRKTARRHRVVWTSRCRVAPGPRTVLSGSCVLHPTSCKLPVPKGGQGLLA